jgi:hypothetical protein
MRSDFINEDADLKASELCLHDSNIGFSTNFSHNGDVDRWTYYDGIYTYGCWGGFLFGTLYGTTGTIGRYEVFRPLNCEHHYYLKIVMKYNAIPRIREQVLPTTSKVYWRTLSDPNWSESKSLTFTLYPDNNWHVYVLNMGVAQYWQGDVNDLRLVIATGNGQDGDEFFIRQISIFSVENYVCKNASCDYYTQYIHNCPGVGARACLTSIQHPDDSIFNIYENETLVLNINNYGDETFTIEEVQNASGYQMAFVLTRLISEVNIGGYAENRVVYENNRFNIYTGTYTPTSSIVMKDGVVARRLGFFDEWGVSIATTTSGHFPASGFVPLSSYKIRTHELLNLFDSSVKSYVNFNPFLYNIEGGRRDWADSLGMTSYSLGHESDSAEGFPPQRRYLQIENAGKTVIDFNSPFNASGRVVKINAAVSLDPPGGYEWLMVDENNNLVKYFSEATRIYTELHDAKVLILRPKKNGDLEVIYEIAIPNRVRGVGKLYSTTQECIDLDVDLYIHRGDLMGVYNAHVYAGKTVTGNEIDAQYFQLQGKPSGTFTPGKLRGQGCAGLLMYARSNEVQNKIVVDIDLQRRYNLESIEVRGIPYNQVLEYNFCRCLDMNQFTGDTFGLMHYTVHKTIIWPDWWVYQRPNTMYGFNRLTDGITVVKDGYAADSFSITGNWSGSVYKHFVADAGPGEVPVNPQYFWVNGDHEWLAMHLHNADYMTSHAIQGFDYDPFALTLLFPLQKEKTITKCKIFFKDQFNFRSWAYSVYKGDQYTQGNADNAHFDYITDITKVTLDNIVYELGSPLYSQIDQYLFANPFIGHPITQKMKAYYDYDSATARYVYSSSEIIVNDPQYTQALNTDWRTISHEWEPVKAKGFRIYCDYHKATKIAEIEIYGSTKDVGSNMSGGINLLFSDYGERWWAPEAVESEEGVVEFVIGDTPRYVQIEFTPVTEIKYSDVIFNANTEDFYAGPKGCTYEYFSTHAKRGTTSESQLIEFKNIYNTAYDLYVDIPAETLEKSSLIFYSKMDTPESVSNPVIGPDAIYIKEDEYPLTFKGRNCAINCHCWGLRNLIQGHQAYYQNSEISPRVPIGALTHNQIINYTNVGASNRSVLKLPVLSRNRYWKIAATNPGLKVNVREMRAFRDGEQLDADFYYEIGDARYTNLCKSIGGAASASVGTAANAFDDDLSTYWEGGPINVWLGFMFTAPTIVQGLYLRSPGVSYTPQTFVFRASVSGTFTGTDVVDLGIFNETSTYRYVYDDYVCNPLWEYDTTTTLMNFSYDLLDNLVPYKYYRIYMLTDTNNRYSTTSNNFRITEMALTRPTAYRDFYTKSLERPATHIENDSVTGSYYRIFKNDCVGFDLGAQKELDTIEFYHDAIPEIETQYYHVCTGAYCEGHDTALYDNYCGIDTAVWLYLTATGDRNNFTIRDESYYEHPLTLGSGVVKENDYDYVTISGYSFSEDFSDCLSLTDWFVRNNGLFSCTASGSDHYIQFNFSASTSPASYSKYLRLVPNTYSKRFVVDEKTAFKARFKISFDDFYMQYQGVDRSGSVCVGVVGGYVGGGSYAPGGVCFVIGTSQYSYTQYAVLAFQDKYHAGLKYEYYRYSTTVIPTASGALSTGVPYYIEITSDGNYTYGAKIWSDDWDGANLLGSASTKYYNKISASEVGFFYEGGYANYSGKLWEVHVDYINKSTSKKQIGGSIAFDGNPITIPNNYGMVMVGKSFLLDFYVMFYELPSLGAMVELFHAKDDTFRLVLTCLSPNNYELKLYATNFSTHSRSLGFYINQWHHICLAGYPGSYGSGQYQIMVDGAGGWSYGQINNINNFAGFTIYDFEIGNGLKGLISHFRLSSDNADVTRGFMRTAYPLPLKKYTKKFSFSIYCSADNISFGKYADVDLFNGYTNVYYYPESQLSSYYNSYFYLNMGQRHFLDIVRNYGTATTYALDKNKYITYSNTETDNIDEANFHYTEDISDSFSGAFKPDTFLWAYTDNSDLYLDAEKLRLKINGSSITRQELRSQYLLVGDFDIQIDYQNIAYSNFRWQTGLFVEDSVTFNQVGVQRRFDSTYQNSYMAVTQADTMVYYRPIVETAGTIRLRRRGPDIKAYYRKGAEWDLVYHWVNWSFNDAQVVLKSYAPTSYEFYLDNFIASKAEAVRKDGYKDAQWVRVNLPNGDSTSRLIYKLGIYPEISVNVSPSQDKHNTYWDYLGPSVTDYTEGTNFALDATVTGSSYVKGMEYSFAVDGFYGETLNDCWGSGNETTPWIMIDLGELRNIYRIKLYHGFSSTNTDILAQNYQIQYSTDGSSFTTLFTITNNTALERTHDVATPVSMRYVRIVVSLYKSTQIYIRAGEEYVFFKGVCFREIEVYGYYGYPIISSELYPIIGINLRDQFFLGTDHTLIGVDAESTTTDWTNASGAYAYSDNPFHDPEGVIFRPFGSTPRYDQWIAIRQNTATNYGDGPDYLKNAIIRANHTPNPCDYYWWWTSNISTVSRGYSDVLFSVFPVKIEYPASSAVDIFSLRAGDDFGIDELLSWRDGLNFRLHIDDIDNLDLSYGYFFISGEDGTSQKAPIEYRWYFTTYSGLGLFDSSGWIAPFLQFKYADEIIYDTKSYTLRGENPLVIYEAKFNRVGMSFRGKGESITMYFDGTNFGRNHFESYSKFGQGLYLKGNDVFTAPIGEFSPNYGTIEFWLRPDYNFSGVDYVNRFKYRSVFYFGNSSGDVFGMSVGSPGLTVYYGNKNDLRAFVIGGLSIIKLDTLLHIGIVYSANGRATGDGSTIKVFINNTLVGSNFDTWEVLDSKLFKFTFGGQGMLALKEADASFNASSVDGVVSELKIYNYCKDNFYTSLLRLPDEEKGDNLIKPSKFIEISNDNLTFYKVGAAQLPFVFKSVPPGVSVPIYYRTVLPKELSGAEKRTSAIIASWDIGV